MVRQELRSYASDTDTDHDGSGRREEVKGLQLRQQISYLIWKLKAFTLQLTAATSGPSSKFVLHGEGNDIRTGPERHILTSIQGKEYLQYRYI